MALLLTQRVTNAIRKVISPRVWSLPPYDGMYVWLKLAQLAQDNLWEDLSPSIPQGGTKLRGHVTSVAKRATGVMVRDYPPHDHALLITYALNLACPGGTGSTFGRSTSNRGRGGTTKRGKGRGSSSTTTTTSKSKRGRPAKKSTLAAADDW